MEGYFLVNKKRRVKKTWVRKTWVKKTWVRKTWVRKTWVKKTWVKKKRLGKICRGSITAEAAIAFPVFFMIVICIVSIMNVYGTTLDRMSSLRDTAEAAAVAAGLSGEERWIDLNVPVYFKPYFLPDGLTGAVVPARARVRVWNGRSEAESQGSSESDEKYVYVTENRSVYHTNAHCTHMELSTRMAPAAGVSSLRNSDGSRYRPCEKCCHGGHTGAIVFITDDGDRYHSSAECSGLKRTVKLVPASSVCDLPQCSRCAAAAASG